MQRFRPFLLDRLLDDFPISAGGVEQPLVSIDQLKGSVARDVESLLNARKRRTDASEPSAVERSVVAFGLDDLSSLSADSSSDRERICAAIVAALRTHETRLRSVAVSVVPDTGQPRRLRFAIRALLVIHPLSEPVSFDAVLLTTTQHYAVTPSRRGH